MISKLIWVYIFRNDYCRYWGYMLTFQSPCVCWRIPNTNWRAHTELCHRNPDTFKRPGTMLNQSRYPSQLRGNAHLCKLKRQPEQWRASITERKTFSPFRQIITFLYTLKEYLFKKIIKSFSNRLFIVSAYMFISYDNTFYSALLILSSF